MEVCNYM